MTKPTFGERVRAYREKKLMSYRAAAAASGVDKGCIVRVEQGLEPSLNTFCRLVRWTGMSAKEAVLEFQEGREK